MIRIAKVSNEEREVLFGNAAQKAGIDNPAIVEKDFWVTLILGYLFQKSPWKKSFIFKGGTSLSKAYHVIERFSEDIDLIMDWRLLGYTSKEPWEARTHTQQDKFNKMVIHQASEFLSTQFVPQIAMDLSELIGIPVEISMDPNDKEQCTVNVYYPHIYHTDYIRQEIRLEIGPLAEWIPSHDEDICSIAAEQYPAAFLLPNTIVPTVDAERTFWEKATILHKTASSYAVKGIPDRYARHYYDLYSMSKTALKKTAFERFDLLEQDIRFKLKFYYSQSASYETARIGSLKLIPEENAIKDLKNDYEHMKSMIYGEKPTFEEIITGLASLEKEINMLRG